MNKKSKSSKVSFKKPPLNEVVIGIQFETLPKFMVGHVGKLWSFYDAEYTNCREQPALVAQVEILPKAPSTIQLTPTLMPRTVFGTVDNSSVIQVQRDAFYFNWQKTALASKYPRYETISANFHKQFLKFTDFVAREDLGEIKPFQFELTYLNEIPIDTGGIRLLKDFSWNLEDHKTLAEPEAVNLQASFLFPDGTGRLHSSFRIFHKPDGEMIYHWAFVARGSTIPRSEMSLVKLKGWLDNANKMITDAFVDLSTDEAQKTLWKRES
jgi:uncharacterized protein (TIGR04255 family)